MTCYLCGNPNETPVCDEPCGIVAGKPTHVYGDFIQSPLISDIDGKPAVLRAFEVRAVEGWSPDGFPLPSHSIRFLVDSEASGIECEEVTIVLSAVDAARLVGAIAASKSQPYGVEVQS